MTELMRSGHKQEMQLKISDRNGSNRKDNDNNSDKYPG